MSSTSIKRKRIFKKKFLLKIFSLFTGVFIWMYVVSSAEIEVNIVAPLKFELPKGLAIKNEIPSEVTYRFKGPGLLVRKLLEKDIKIYIKKTQYYKKRKYRYKINIEDYNFKLPISVEQVSVEPRSLSIRLEASMTREVKIKPVFADNMLQNFKIKKLKIFPEVVSISGPKSVIKRIKSLETKLIDKLETQGGTQGDASFFVHLVNPDGRIKLSVEQINISYQLKSRNIEKQIKEIPIVFQSSHLIKMAYPKVISVIVSGDEAKVNSLRQQDIHILAPVPKMFKNKQEIELITELPQGIKLIKLIPDKVTIEME